MQWRDMPIEDFELHADLENGLRAAGVTTLGQLWDMVAGVQELFDDLFSDNPEWRPQG